MSSFFRKICVAFLLLGAAACGGSPTAPGGGGGGGVNSLSIVSGGTQTFGTSAQLVDPLVVRVNDPAGAALSGVTVTWAVTASAGAGAMVTPTSSTTDVSGTASTRLTLGDAPGSYTVTASIAAPASVMFTAMAQLRVASAVVKLSGDGQSAMVSTALPQPFALEVRDQFGAPIPQLGVAFSISRGSSGLPSITPASATTDSAGRAAVALTLGDRNGTYGVLATADTASAEFTATATGGAQNLVGVSSVTPDTLTEGGTATVTGNGFSVTPGNNTVWIDGRSGTVTMATDTTLTVTVPTFQDQCLPRRAISVQVAVGPDSAGPVASRIKPDPSLTLTLAPGQSAAFAGPAAVGCVQLPPAAMGVEYEVIATMVPAALGFNSGQLFLNGGPPLTSVTLPLPGGVVRAPTGQGLSRSVSLPQSLAGASHTIDSLAVQIEWDRQLRERGRPLLSAIHAQAASSFGLFAMPSVGDSANFSVSCTQQPAVRAVVRSVSSAAVVYEDTASSGVFSAAQYDSIAAEFDTIMFATDTAYFGAPGDIDGNGRVAMLFTPAVNALTTGNYNNGFVAGFFCESDLVSGAGNHAEMFYLLVPDPTGQLNGGGGSLTQTDVRTGTPKTIGHEFQHLINAQIGVAGQGATDVWINEGLSHLAEEVNGHTVSGNTPGMELGAANFPTGPAFNRFVRWYSGDFINLSLYLGAPADTAALLVAVDPAPDNVLGSLRMRGAAWSFLRYLLDRFGTPATETALTRALILGSGSARATVTSVFGMSFEDLVADWNAMFAVEDRGDLGGVPPAELTLPSYKLRDLYTSISLDASKDPNNLVFGYPLAPLTQSLTTGGTAGANLFTATAQFVTLSAAAASGGTGVRFATPAGADLNGITMPRLEIVRTK